MSMTPAEQSFCELNQQITQIVKKYTDNHTSYFPNIEKVLEAFQAYLQCVPIKDPFKPEYFKPQSDCFLFREKVNIKFLAKIHNFNNLLISWDFGFSHQFRHLITETSLNSNKHQEPFLSQVSVTQIMFLMYIGLEVQRKEILGKDFKFERKRNFLLKEVIHILEDCFRNNDDQPQDPESMFSFNSYFVNEEKLMEKVQQKTFKLRLQKENFSFSPFFNSVPKNSPKNGSRTINESIEQILKKAEGMVKNESLVSVKSEFEESRYLQGQELRKYLNGGDGTGDSERMGYGKKCTNEEVFRNIWLRK